MLLALRLGAPSHPDHRSHTNQDPHRGCTARSRSSTHKAYPRTKQREIKTYGRNEVSAFCTSSQGMEATRISSQHYAPALLMRLPAKHHILKIHADFNIQPIDFSQKNSVYKKARPG